MNPLSKVQDAAADLLFMPVAHGNGTTSPLTAENIDAHNSDNNNLVPTRDIPGELLPGGTGVGSKKKLSVRFSEEPHHSRRSVASSGVYDDADDVRPSELLQSQLSNYPLQKEFTTLINAFLKKRYWYVQSDVQGNMLFDVNSVIALMPRIGDFLKARSTASVGENAQHCSDFEFGWLNELKQLSDKFSACIHKYKSESKQNSYHCNAWVEIDATELKLLIQTFDRCRLEKDQDVRKPTGLSSEMIASSSSQNVQRVHPLQEEKADANWLLFTQSASSLVQSVINSENTPRADRENALAFLNLGREIGILSEIDETFEIDDTSLTSWIGRWRLIYGQLNIRQTDDNEPSASDWERIFLQMTSISMGILNSANEPLRLNAGDSATNEMDPLDSLKTNLKNNLSREVSAYFQVFNHPQIKQVLSGEKPSLTNPNRRVIAIATLFKNIQELRTKIVDRTLNADEAEKLRVAIQSVRDVLANLDFPMLHGEVSMQLNYFCNRFSELSASLPTARNDVASFFSAFEGFVSAHFSLDTKPPKSTEYLKRAFQVWEHLWTTKYYISEYVSSTLSDQAVQLVGFDSSWSAVKEPPNLWPSLLYRKIFAIEPIEEPIEVQLCRKLKIYILLHIFELIFKKIGTPLALCKNKEGKYSDFYTDLISKSEMYSEESFPEYLFSKLKEKAGGRFLEIFLARSIYYFMAPVLDHILEQFRKDSNRYIDGYASELPDADAIRRLNTQLGDHHPFKAKVVERRNEIFQRISGAFTEILNVDGDYHKDPNPKTGKAIDNVKKSLENSRYHAGKGKDEIYYDADRALVHSFSYAPEWTKNITAFIDGKRSSTEIRVFQIFCDCAKYMAVAAFYIPEKITEYALRELVFYFYHESGVSTSGIVNLLMKKDSANPALNNLFYNLLVKLENAVLQEQRRVDTVVEKNRPLYETNDLVNYNVPLNDDEQKLCNEAILALLQVLGRYKASFALQKPLGDTGIVEEQAEDKKIAMLALEHGGKFIKLLDSILRREFIKGQYADLLLKLNDTLDGKPAPTAPTMEFLTEKTQTIATRVIELAIASKVVVSGQLNEAHKRSYEKAFQEIYEKTIGKALNSILQAIDLHRFSSENPKTCLDNLQERLEVIEQLEKPIDEFEKQIDILKKNAVQAKIGGVTDIGEQIKKQYQKIVTEIVNRLNFQIRAVSDLKKPWTDLSERLKNLDLIQKAQIGTFGSNTVLRFGCQGDPNSAMLYFAHHISLTVAKYVNKTALSENDFRELCASLQELGIFPTHLTFVEENLTAVPLFNKSHDWNLVKGELDPLLISIANNLYRSLRVVHQDMMLPAPSNPANSKGSLASSINDALSILGIEIVSKKEAPIPRKGFNPQIFQTQLVVQNTFLEEQKGERTKKVNDKIMQDIHALSGRLEQIEGEFEDQGSSCSLMTLQKSGSDLSMFAFNEQHPVQQIVSQATVVLKQVVQVVPRGVVDVGVNLARKANLTTNLSPSRYESIIHDRIENLRGFFIGQNNFFEYIVQRMVLFDIKKVNKSPFASLLGNELQ